MILKKVICSCGRVLDYRNKEIGYDSIFRCPDCNNLIVVTKP